MQLSRWSAGDWAIYRKPKRSVSPGRRARNVVPAARGETYNYTIDKYWVVREVLDDDRLLLQTRRGKQHEVSVDDPLLRRPRFWQRWLFRHRFVAVEASMNAPSPDQAP